MAGWVTTLIISVLAYVILMSCVFPHGLLKTDWVIRAPRDRGIKNVKETTGRTIVYQPALEYRKYLPQYLISERDEKKILLCKLSPNVKYIDYDVVTYNAWNRVCKVINVKELIEKDVYTEQVALDKDVAYVSIIVNAVNGQMVTERKKKPVGKWKITGYTTACILATFLEILLIKLCCSNIFGGVFRETFMVEGNSVWLTVAIAGAAAVVNLICVIVAIVRNNRWTSKKGEN